MDLFILRHGEAGKRSAGVNDYKRPLTAAGEREIDEIAGALKKIGIEIDVILTSPLKRAQQTADIIAREFKGQKKMRQLQELAPEGSRHNLYRIFSSLRQGASILVVGHNPYLNEMVGEVITDGKYGRIDIKKGGVARIRITSAVPGVKGELRWLLTPRLLRLISKV